MKSLYSSLDSAVNVKVGDEVKSGDVIGKVGDTANGEHTDGAHLHFEFYRDGVKVNPNDYIAFAEK
ncbi:MAG: peptidoglycan DD-metalloendopeptidase family protein, partial [Christensenellales bacterium]